MFFFLNSCWTMCLFALYRSHCYFVLAGGKPSWTATESWSEGPFPAAGLQLNQATRSQVPARYMYIIQPLIPAMNLNHKVLCQHQNMSHHSGAAGGAAWRMGRRRSRRARALPSLSIDAARSRRQRWETALSLRFTATPIPTQYRTGLLLFCFLVESCQENYFSSFASFLLVSFLSEPVVHRREQLSQQCGSWRGVGNGSNPPRAEEHWSLTTISCCVWWVCLGIQKQHLMQ